jgi:transcription elongation GreA/GreB family factor
MKRRLIDQLKKHFEEEIRDLESAGHGPESQALQEKRRALLMYRFLPVRDFDAAQIQHEVIAPGSLVQVETAGRRSWVLIVTLHGGLITDFEGLPVQVLSHQSPLGEVLLGKKAGESIELSTASGAKRSYGVLSAC